MWEFTSCLGAPLVRCSGYHRLCSRIIECSSIASTALALPAVNKTNSNLAERYEHGWTGNFEDGECSGTPVGPRPEIRLDDCVAFKPSMSAGFVGIFFGTGVYDFDQLMLYSDTECQTEMGPIFKEDYTTGSFGCMNYQDPRIYGSIQTVESA